MIKPADRDPDPRTRHPWLLMASLVVAGESIYMLPYMRKSFQTSMEATFGLSAFEIGTLNALFGTLALVSYLPGGWLADRIPTRRLLTFSLVATGLGGFYMAARPGYAGLLAVHAFWGITSILTFWAALIKATRLWFDAQAQGRAFGILDGGRGVVAAVLASAAAWVFDASGSTEAGLVRVITLYSLASVAAGAAVWLVVPDDRPEPVLARHGQTRSQGLGKRWPDVILMTGVILCAYFLYLGTFEFPAFAERGFGRSKAFGAWLGAFRDWLRPVAAVLAGVVADRVSPSRTITVLFAVLVATFGLLAALPAGTYPLMLLWLQVATAALAVFALRGIYFALLEETRIPLHRTGVTVGAVSMVAYTPDIFAPLAVGWLVEANPGVLGYRLYFAILGVTAVGGMAAGLALRNRSYRRA